MLTNLIILKMGKLVRMYVWMYVCILTTTINIEMDFISLGQHLALLGRTHGWTLGSILLIGEV